MKKSLLATVAAVALIAWAPGSHPPPKAPRTSPKAGQTEMKAGPATKGEATKKAEPEY